MANKEMQIFYLKKAGTRFLLRPYSKLAATPSNKAALAANLPIDNWNICTQGKFELIFSLEWKD